eukprot:2141382-Rhodomonas_salina.1
MTQPQMVMQGMSAGPMQGMSAQPMQGMSAQPMLGMSAQPMLRATMPALPVSGFRSVLTLSESVSAQGSRIGRRH